MISHQIDRISKNVKPRVGLYTCGLKAYWEQFENLRERLLGYGNFIEKEICAMDAEVYNFGLVDDVYSGRKAGEFFNSKNVDIIYCHVGTYVTSSVILPIHQICKATVIVLNLQPTAKMNYEKSTTGEWLAHCNSCPVPEISNAFNRARINFNSIHGLLGLSETPVVSLSDERTSEREEAKRVWKEIREWISAAKVFRTLRYANFGFLGNTYSGMLDMYSDVTMIQAQTGIHVEMLEMCDLNHYVQQVSEDDITRKIEEIKRFFTISGDSPSDPIAKKPTTEQLSWSAKLAVAQEYMIRDKDLDALVYYYHGIDDNEYERLQAGGIVGYSLLTAAGVPCSGEGDLKTGVAMKICDTLGIGGSFSEIVAVDYDEQTIILGHDGPFHIMISNDKPKLRGMGVYHGKKGSGVSIEANVVAGDITTLGVTQTYEDGVKFIASEGVSTNLPILTIGNTQSHVKFNDRPDIFMDRWFAESPTHHCAMAVGHNAALMRKVAYLLNIKYQRV